MLPGADHVRLMNPLPPVAVSPVGAEGRTMKTAETVGSCPLQQGSTHLTW